MVNPFGRGRPKPGGLKPPPSHKTDSIRSDISRNDDPSPGYRNKRLQANIGNVMHISKVKHFLRTQDTTTPLNQCSQSGKTFVEVRTKVEKKLAMAKTVSKSAPPVVSPDKGTAAISMTTLSSNGRKSSFFSSKRKQSDAEEKWTRERIEKELEMLVPQEDLDQLHIKDMSENEIRKEFYKVVSNTKKSKGNDDATMDVGQFLMDSTMLYVPSLNENSTDMEIE